MTIKLQMDVDVIGEAGYYEAMFGMGLSFGLTSGMSFKEFSESSSIEDQEKRKRMSRVLEANAPKDGGHNKFLESIQLWLDISAPRYWWSEFDTYRVGTSKQSASTMHTLVKQMNSLLSDANALLGISTRFQPTCGYEKVKEYYIEHFEHTSDEAHLSDAVFEFARKISKMNKIACPIEQLVFVKGVLTENYLQRRIVSTNYKTLRSVILQRRGHRLPHWEMFVKDILAQVEHPELLPNENIQGE